jgi:hypothetical protein
LLAFCAVGINDSLLRLRTRYRLAIARIAMWRVHFLTAGTDPGFHG